MLHIFLICALFQLCSSATMLGLSSSGISTFGSLRVESQATHDDDVLTLKYMKSNFIQSCLSNLPATSAGLYPELSNLRYGPDYITADVTVIGTCPLGEYRTPLTLTCTQAGWSANMTCGPPIKCQDLASLGSGYYTLKNANTTTDVYCREDIDGGAWTLAYHTGTLSGSKSIRYASNDISLLKNDGTSYFMGVSPLTSLISQNGHSETLYLFGNGAWIIANVPFISVDMPEGGETIQNSASCRTGSGSTPCSTCTCLDVSLTARGGDIGISATSTFVGHSSTFRCLNSGCTSSLLSNYLVSAGSQNSGYSSYSAMTGWSALRSCSASDSGAQTLEVYVR